MAVTKHATPRKCQAGRTRHDTPANTEDEEQDKDKGKGEGKGARVEDKGEGEGEDKDKDTGAGEGEGEGKRWDVAADDEGLQQAEGRQGEEGGRGEQAREDGGRVRLGAGGMRTHLCPTPTSLPSRSGRP